MPHTPWSRRYPDLPYRWHPPWTPSGGLSSAVSQPVSAPDSRCSPRMLEWGGSGIVILLVSSPPSGIPAFLVLVETGEDCIYYPHPGDRHLEEHDWLCWFRPASLACCSGNGRRWAWRLRAARPVAGICPGFAAFSPHHLDMPAKAHQRKRMAGARIFFDSSRQ